MFPIFSLSLWLLSSFCLGNAFHITSQGHIAQPSRTVKRREELAVVPTTAGEIGINPVESDLGDADSYVGEIYGTDTQYITISDITTQVCVLSHTLRSLVLT